MRLRLLVAVTLVVLLLLPNYMPLGEAQYTGILYPIGDSWVEAEYPNTNHGSETVLRVKSDSRTRRTYVRFDLNSLPNGKIIKSVRLFLYCTAVDSNPSVVINAQEMSDGWAEGTITWNNAPAVGAFISNATIGASGQYYSWNITQYAVSQYSGDKILSVVVKLPQDIPGQNNPNYARDFASKEYTGTNRDPYLEVVYEDSPPVASFTYAPTYPMANDTTAFNASASYDPDGTIASYNWNFGDGNVTTVTGPTITHVYTTFGNFTVTLTVTDGTGLTSSQTQTVEVVDPAVLHVSLPGGTYMKQTTGDPWIDEGWLLNKTGNSWSFTLKIEDVSSHVHSYDTHLIVALNTAAYNNILSLSINGTSIPKSAFKNGTPKPYGTKYWTDKVFPTWFNDTYINIGYIPPKGAKTLTVSVTFSDSTNARMHFDAYGSVNNGAPCSWSQVTWTPNSEDSTVLYQAAPPPLSVSITPPSAVIDLGQYVSLSSTVSGGTAPYTYQWYVNGTAVPGANSATWIFTPTSSGYYLVYLNVTDSTGTTVQSSVSPVTVNPSLSVSISPVSSVVTLGQSVLFTSTVSGGTPLYSYQWYLNSTAVSGATSSTWTFTPASTGFYVVFLRVTDSVTATAISNNAYVTVNLPTFYLTVKTDPLGIVAIPGEGWYPQGTNVGLTAPSTVPISADSQYRFSYWDVNGTLQGVGVNPITVTMSANYVATAHYIVQYKVVFDQTGMDSTATGTIATVNGSAKAYGTPLYSVFVDTGTSFTYAYTATVPSSVSGKRFVLVSVTGPSSPFTVSGTVTVAGNYKTQYYLNLTSNPTGIASPTGSGWYDVGTYAAISTPQDVPGGSRYHFIGWVTANMSEITDPSLPSTTVYMDEPKTVTANYVHQYLVTFKQTGLTSDATGTVVTVNGTPVTYGGFDYAVWVDENGVVTYSYEATVASSISDKQFVRVSVSGPSSPVTVTADMTITGNYKVQYRITFSQTGVDTDFTGTVMFVDGTPYDHYGLSVWFDNGSSHTFAFQSPLTVTPNAKQYVWTSTTGLSTLQTGSISVSASGSVTGNYGTQYYLTVTSPYATTGGEGWYNNGATAYATLTVGIVDQLNGTRRVFTNWSGDASGTNYVQSNPIVMNGPKTATAVWKKQYYLTVTSAYDSPTPTSDWFDAGASITASVTSPWAGPTGIRYVCTGWTGTGSVPSSGSSASVMFTINTPSSITWNWKTQYLLTVLTEPSGLSPQPTRNPMGEAGPANGWWYDASTGVTLTAQAVTGYVFSYWKVDGSSQGSGVNPISVSMNGPHTAVANYTVAAPPLSVSITPLSATITIGGSVIFTSAPSGGTSPYSYQWYLDGNPVPGATSSGWTFIPPSTGVYHVYVKVTDSMGNVVQSATAEVTVGPKTPVGGYAISLAKQTPMFSFAMYVALVAFFGALLSLAKRKRK